MHSIAQSLRHVFCSTYFRVSPFHLVRQRHVFHTQAVFSKRCSSISLTRRRILFKNWCDASGRDIMQQDLDTCGHCLYTGCVCVCVQLHVAQQPVSVPTHQSTGTQLGSYRSARRNLDDSTRSLGCPSECSLPVFYGIIASQTAHLCTGVLESRGCIAGSKLLQSP